MRLWALGLLLLAVLLNLCGNAVLPLHFDEAYYWVWSQRLQWSYFDHPPMIAYLVRLATFFGHAEWQVRLAPLACAALTALGIWRLAEKMFDSKVACRALVIFLLSPLAQMGFTLATPDAPLILGWTAAVFFAYGAVFEGNKWGYYLAGATAGFALLAKYTAVLLLPAFFFFLLFSRKRCELKKRGPYAAVIVAFLVFLPVVLWNYQHDWVSFQFQLNHGMAGERRFNLATFGEYLGVQAGGLNPVFFLALLYLLVWRFRSVAAEDRQAFLLWPCLTVLAFFGYAALFKRVEGNWAAPAYVTGIILLAKWLDATNRVWVYRCGIVLGLIMTLFLKAPEAFEFLPKSWVMKRQVLGYDVMFRSAGGVMNGVDLALAADYKLASLAWYYLPGNPEVHVLTKSRKSQYDFWRIKPEENIGRSAVYFGSADQAAELARLFEVVTELPSLVYEGPYVSREIKVYRCLGLKR